MATLTYTNVPFENNFELAKIVAAGMPADVLRQIASLLGITPAKLAPVVQIAARTLERRLKDNETLKPDETERTLRVGRLLHIAEGVFEDREVASEWFGRPLKNLAGLTPLQLCATEPGSREVEQMLERIEHGVFS
jgi:putative toxin-antitoxin system antitoxin component (TIGR02293 family)